MLSKYLRLRAQNRFAFAPQLWLSRRGALSYDALWHIVKRAAQRGGVIGARPHLYRHTFAHEMKMAGASDEVLMSLAGWNTFYMPSTLRPTATDGASVGGIPADGFSG